MRMSVNQKVIKKTNDVVGLGRQHTERRFFLHVSESWRNHTGRLSEFVINEFVAPS